jgi:TP901 family phage tail tape measure protein
VTVSDNRSVLVELRAQVGSYIAGIQNARKATRDMLTEATRDTKANNANLQALGRTGLIVGGVIAAGLGLAIKQFAEFDHAMSNVKAVTGATTAELNQLKDAAIQAGAVTVFNAKDAADAEGELAKAGVSVRDILGGGLTGALNLAAAGQIGVADAANIAATAMVQFGKDGSAVPHIADLLAAAANKAQGGVDDMATALKYVGPIAHQMGISLEETTGTIAELANNGILADQAGTDLRGVLSSLTSPSKIAADTMKSLGINVYDAKGNFVGFSGVADQLSQHMGTLSNAERDQALGRIFGNAQITAARILYAGGAADVNKWTKAVNDDGAAARIAHTNLDNLAGDFEQLKGSIQTALIQQGSTANVSLRKLTEGATGAVNSFAGLPRPLQYAGTALAGVSSAALLSAGAVGTMLPKIRAARTELEGLGSAGTFASKGIGALGKAGFVGAIVAGIAVGLHGLTVEINNLTGHGTPEIDNLTNSLLKFRAGGKASGETARLFGKDMIGLNRDIAAVSGAGAKFNTGFGILPSRVDNARRDIDALDKSLGNLVSSGHADVAQKVLKQVTDSIGPAAAGNLVPHLDDYRNALTNADTQQQLTAQSADQQAQALGYVDASAQDAAAAVKAYATALTDTTAIDAYTATAQTSQAFKDLTKNLKDGGKVTDAEKISLGSFASQVKSAAGALNDNGASQKRVNAYLKDGRQKFEEAAVAAGYGADQAKRLAHNLIAIPKRTDIPVDTSQIEKANRELRKLIGLLTRAGATQAVGRGIAGKLTANPGLVDAQHRAGGGPFGAGPLLVGERGPELLYSSGSGTVTNADSTARILTTASAGSVSNSTTHGPTFSPSYTIVTADPMVAAQKSTQALKSMVFERTGRVV